MLLLLETKQVKKGMDLFSPLRENNVQIPLAQMMRPKTLEEFFGQGKIISQNSPIINLIKSNRLFSFIFWGPPGCGKTTLARIIANNVKADFIELSATESGVRDIKDVVTKAKDSLIHNIKTVLFIDEIHRYSKTQQDALLPHIESGLIYLIGSTTENPSFQVNPALISRVSVIKLESLEDEDIEKIVLKGLEYLSKKNGEIEFSQKHIDYIVNFALGDARCALNLVEKAYYSAKIKENKRYIEMNQLEQLEQKSALKYSRQEHFDLASAFQKSLRGSDKNASIYYLAKMIMSGEDPRFIARRLIVCASEDVGNEDPQALAIALNAYRAVEILGISEGRIALSQAVEYVANAKKSNRAIVSIDKAIEDIKSSKNYNVPKHLMDSHYKSAKDYGFGVGYHYSHNDYGVKQQYLPDELVGRKYFDD